MRVLWSLSLFALACNFTVEGTHAEGPVAESSGGVGEVGGDGDDDGNETGETGGETGVGESGGAACGELHDADECFAAGCVPVEVTSLVVDGEIDDACRFSDAVVLCAPQEESQGCDDARVCSGQHTWVMPLPDGGAFVARVDVSCGLPEGFLPCPEPADPNGLVDGNALGGSATSDGGSEPNPLVEACACACG